MINVTDHKETVPLMKFHRRILPALAVGGVLLIAGCGDENKSSTNSSPAAGNPVDRAFVADMIPHHEDAVQMAQIAQRRGSSAFVKQLAEDIVRTQKAEIATLRAADQRLKTAGVKRGSLGVGEHMMGMDDNPASLKSAKPFDRSFMRMMIPHHEGAIVMANAELKKGKDAALKKLAQDIITAQQREIAQMRKQLTDADAAGTQQSGEHHGALPTRPSSTAPAAPSSRRGDRASSRSSSERSPDMPPSPTASTSSSR